MAGREFGDVLRPIIERTGQSIRQLATRLGWDHAKLVDLVNGRGGTSEAELTYLLGICGATAGERDHVLDLFHDSRERGLLQFHEAVPAQVRTLMCHEQRATKITVWSPIVIPGLLQIPAYIRAVAMASPLIARKDVDQLTAARIARGEIVDSSRQFTFYVLQHALTMPVADPDVVRDQLYELLRMTVRPYVSVRIVRVAVMPPFVVMNFEGLEPIVYLESPNTTLFLDDKASTAFYAKAVEALDHIALGEEESKEVIRNIVT
ncbi:hypothetical protein Lesp02_04510 [Lentzea sp. NBRC 105346]|nr:hypothetical protein Lesp02_04510 [Lentzea sp. NBRC 105346]